MKRLLRELNILMLEDVPTDAELVERELERSKIWYRAKRVDTRDDFEKALKEFSPDLILADYSLPQFDGITALQIAHSKLPDVPFLFVSGSIGEERAVEALRHGATDYIIKDRLQRLGPAVLRAMEDVTARVERQRADAALRISEERFRTVAAATTDGIWDWDVATNRVWLSAGVRRLFGYDDAPEYADLEWICSRLHPEDAPRVRADILKFVQEGNGEFWKRGYRFRRGDGGYSHVLDRARVLREANGRGVRVVAALSDVTERVQSERHQAMQFAITRVLAEAGSLEAAVPQLIQGWCEGVGAVLGALWLVDANADRLYCAGTRSTHWLPERAVEAACRQMTFSRGEGLPGRVWQLREPLLVSHIDRDSGFERWSAAAQDQLEHVFAFPITSGMSFIGVVESFFRDNWEGDAPPKNVAHDIGSQIGQFVERKRAEAAVERLSRQNQLILESAADGICGIDSRGVATFVNPAAARMLGWTAEELAGRNLHEAVHYARPDGSPYRWEECPASISLSRGTTEKREEVFWRKDGSTLQVEYSSTPMVDQQGHRLGAVLTFRNLEERRFLERQLEQATRLSSLGRLAATIAHEINNVLMGIQPFAEVIHKQAAHDLKIQKAGEQIIRSVQRGKSITQEILRYTRPAQPSRQPIDLEHWLNEFATEMRGVLPGTMDLVMQLPSQRLAILGDPQQLMQVFSNLVLNARDAMPQGGTIKLVAEPPSARSIYPFGAVPNPERLAHCSVSDNGQGMTTETMARVFEPLFTTKKSGTGLGLAVTHQIVQQHGGLIFVESELQKGSSFHVFLPVAPKPDLDSPDSSHPAQTWN